MKLIDKKNIQKIRRRLTRLYGDRAGQLMERFYMLIGRYGVGVDSPGPNRQWDQKDVVLITYADMVQRADEPPLVTLSRFLGNRLRGAVNTVHILPFYPWSSDDGFSVIDYLEVAPEYGVWDNVEAIGSDFKLMFDLILNHCSAKSDWFRDFETGIAPSRQYFLEMDPETDLSKVVRPRSSPLLTKAYTRNGETWVWTTFSSDQIDLNWRNPNLLFEFLDILFLYISKGMRIVRLDAVAFLWKKPGTTCLHLPKAHEVVKLLRDVLEMVAPNVILLTETNVPHEENISYFGRGDEAHMVYQFSLPPLLLHGLLAGDARHLTAWAAGLPPPPKDCTYLNFTASHDGIGVRPLQGILKEKELDWLIDQVQSRGGLVSYKSNLDGSNSPYELNITYLDALSDNKDAALGRERFMCSQAVALAMRGIPAVYFHSLVGTANHLDGVSSTGQNRAINRRKWNHDELEAILDNADEEQSQIFQRYLTMLRRRADQPAFHPDGEQQVLDLGPDLFCLVRTSPDKNQTIVCLFNFTTAEVSLKFSELGDNLAPTDKYRDILSGAGLDPASDKQLILTPYQAMWLLQR